MIVANWDKGYYNHRIKAICFLFANLSIFYLSVVSVTLSLRNGRQIEFLPGVPSEYCKSGNFRVTLIFALFTNF